MSTRQVGMIVSGIRAVERSCVWPDGFIVGCDRAT